MRVAARVLFFVLVFCAGVGSGVGFLLVGHRGEPLSDSEWARDLITQELKACPGWGAMFGDPGDQACRLVVARLELVRHYPLSVIRQAMAQFMLDASRKTDATDWTEQEACGFWEILDKFLLLNKYIFALPPAGPEDSVLTFGGWDRHGPGPPGAVNYLWPFTKAPNGTLRLTGEPATWLGQHYDPVEAFDYYRSKFGRRRFPWDEGAIDEALDETDVDVIRAILTPLPPH